MCYVKEKLVVVDKNKIMKNKKQKKTKIVKKILQKIKN